jgi:hypothetical protein
VSVFRIVVALLPQAIILLLIGGRFDWLGGFNRTDAGFSTLIALFLVTPVATAVLLLVEVVRYLMEIRRKAPDRTFATAALAFVLFLEALAVDVYLIFQVRMH